MRFKEGHTSKESSKSGSKHYGIQLVAHSTKPPTFVVTWAAAASIRSLDAHSGFFLSRGQKRKGSDNPNTSLSIQPLRKKWLQCESRKPPALFNGDPKRGKQFETEDTCLVEFLVFMLRDGRVRAQEGCICSLGKTRVVNVPL